MMFLHNRNITFIDNFNGNLNLLPNSITWKPIIGDGRQYNLIGWGGNEYEYYTKYSSLLDGSGYLVILTNKFDSLDPNTPQSNSIPGVSASNPNQNVGPATWNSGKISTQNKICFKYGTISIRAKLPIGSGLNFAYWMLRWDYPVNNWPKSGEIDILESPVSNPFLIYGTAHWNGENNPTQNYNNTKNIEFNNTLDYHIYSISWDTTGIKWYVDGIEYSGINKLDFGSTYYPFDEPFFLMIQTAVGGGFAGNPALNLKETKAYVDYVSWSAYTMNNNLVGKLYIQTYQIGSSWSHFRGIYSTNTGQSPFEGPIDFSNIMSYTASGIILSTPAIDKYNNIYFGCDNGKLYCLNSDGQTLKWSYQTELINYQNKNIYGYIRTSPTIGPNDLIYFGTLYLTADSNYVPHHTFPGSLYCLNSSGTLKWSKNLGTSIFSSPAIDSNGLIYVSAFDGYFYCIESISGNIIYSYNININTLNYSSVTIGQNDLVYVGSYNGSVYCFDSLTSYSPIWTYQIPSGYIIYTTPAIDDYGTLYFTAWKYNGSNIAYCIAINTITTSTVLKGSLKWSYTITESSNVICFGSPTIGLNNQIYFTTTDLSQNKLYSLSTISGNVNWICNIPELKTQIQNSPIVDCNGYIYFITYGGKLLRIKDNGDNFEILLLTQILNNYVYSSLALNNKGILYFGALDNKLYSVTSLPIISGTIETITENSIEIGHINLNINTNLSFYVNNKFIDTFYYPNIPPIIKFNDLQQNTEYNIKFKPFKIISDTYQIYGNDYNLIGSTLSNNVACYGENTKILCYDNIYIPIYELTTNILVKTHNNNYIKIKSILKGKMINDPLNWKNCMFKLKENDLYITGTHSILVDKLNISTKLMYKNLNIKIDKIDNKYKLLSGISENFEKMEDTYTYIYYHIVLESDDKNKCYGIYANGILSESLSINTYNQINN
jgi:outer membrane protein assembly factor BamB